MAGFDPELYLRLAGEDLLASRAVPFPDPLAEAAKALVATGVIDESVAVRVCDDYALARSLRASVGPPRGVIQRTAPGGPPPAAGFRVVTLDRTVSQPWGALVLHYAVFRPDTTVLKVSLRRDRVQAGKRGSSRGRGFLVEGPGPLAAPELTVTDDRGATSAGGFRGGGSEWEWQGTYTVQPGLAPDTAWIELLGERIACQAYPARGEVRLEPLTGDAGPRYLRHRALSSPMFGPPVTDLEPVVSALVAAGLLDAGDPAIAPAEALAQAFAGLIRFRGHGRRPEPATLPLPEPWQAVLAAWDRGGGPVGSAVVNVRTPGFEGMNLAIFVLESGEDDFAIDVEVSAAEDAGPGPGAALGDWDLCWSATDDRANRYLGGWSQARSGGGASAGTVRLRPALDPRAARLELVASTATTQALIGIPLDWEHR
jgi:hypothetical protein